MGPQPREYKYFLLNFMIFKISKALFLFPRYKGNESLPQTLIFKVIGIRKFEFVRKTQFLCITLM